MVAQSLATSVILERSSYQTLTIVLEIQWKQSLARTTGLTNRSVLVWCFEQQIECLRVDCFDLNPSILFQRPCSFERELRTAIVCIASANDDCQLPLDSHCALNAAESRVAAKLIACDAGQR